MEKITNVYGDLVGTSERQRFGDLDVDERITLMLRKLGVGGLHVGT
jgi:hypothetical protein